MGVMQTYARMLALLTQRSLTYMDLCSATGKSQTTVAKWIRALRAEKLVYVVGWGSDQRGYPTVPRFGWGVGLTDIKRPTVPDAEHAKRRRAAAKKGVL